MEFIDSDQDPKNAPWRVRCTYINAGVPIPRDLSDLYPSREHMFAGFSECMIKDFITRQNVILA